MIRDAVRRIAPRWFDLRDRLASADAYQRGTDLVLAERQWSIKTYVQPRGAVRVTDHAWSAENVGNWLGEALGLGLFWYLAGRAIAAAPAPLAAGLVVVLSVGPLLATLVYVVKWIFGFRNVVSRLSTSPHTCCECGASTYWAHEFRHVWHHGTVETYRFCSRSCREAWERWSVDYSDADHYAEQRGHRARVNGS